ncbi:MULTISPECIES: DUF4253 domain-containing protein [unclassified Streptomyces]|uniref:DUF4253 domain-containing protein n=1 Tax=unclassified Streptomyces TaxID=2593676 RepID=UPI0035D87785
MLIDTGRRDEGPEDGALSPADTSYPGDHDAEEVLAGAWDAYASDELGDESARWPGLAPSPPRARPGARTNWPPRRPTCSPTPCRRPWCPPGAARTYRRPSAGRASLNHENDVARLCAVLRSWEDRFDIRVVALGFDTLTVYVGRPPTTAAEARPLAAEHFAFCPDTIEAVPPDGLDVYAEKSLLGQETRSFRWH